ncbi:MAG: hypothetical protein JJE04_18265 [Acidobacteriia bacterium]|nr:hypothetical protein [Terriglobia bacterium]
MKTLPLLFLLMVSWKAAAQPVVMAPIPVPGAMLVAPDGRGGVYATGMTGGEPAIFHFGSSGELQTMVTEHGVRSMPGHVSHEEEEEEFLLLHTPGELWLSGDGTRLLFPIFRHLHPVHVAEVLMVENGTLSRFLPVNEKVKYTFNGQAEERLLVNTLKGLQSPDRFHFFSYLGTHMGNDLTQLNPVLFTYGRSAAGAGSYEMTVYLNLESEGSQYSVVDPGCASRLTYLAGIGIPATSFFQPPAFDVLRMGPRGGRETLARGVVLGANAFACTEGEASVIYREGGKTHFMSIAGESPARSFFSGTAIENYPIGQISHHGLSPDGAHYFLMQGQDGRHGVFSVDAQGRASTILAPGFAGQDRVVKSMVVSKTRLFVLTEKANAAGDASDPRILGMYRPSLPAQAVQGIAGGSLDLPCLDCPPLAGMEVEMAGRKYPVAAQQGRFTITNLQAAPGRHEAVLRIYGAELRFPVEILQGGVPVLASSGIVNAASFDGALAPGALATIFGQGLAPTTETAKGFPLPTELGMARVLVDGVAAPLLLVSPAQINFMLPWELGAPAEVGVQVVTGNVRSQEARISIAPAAAGIFQRDGGAYVITTADYRLVDGSNPCLAGEACIVWANGLGRTNRPVNSGFASPPEAEALEQPRLSIDGREATILFAGLAPGLAGVFQINFVMPGEPSGAGVPALVNATLKQGLRELPFQFHARR